MFPPRGKPRFLFALLASCTLTGQLCARAQEEVDPTGQDRLAAYLEGHGLISLLTLHLERRLERASAEERGRIAERLADLYADRLENASTLEERRLWEDRSREFLQQVRESEAFELRISLAKVRYLLAEEIAERARIGLATPEEIAEAERVLQSTATQFHDLFARLNHHLRQLDRRSGSAIEDYEKQLSEARRLRSLAGYYAGWSDYYLALLSRSATRARVALTQFGFILNAKEGEEPELGRLPKGLLRFEHVARAALGTALSFSLTGRHDLAIRWLDTVDENADTHPAVRAQLFARRLIVHSRAGRWADVEMFVERRMRAAEEKEKDEPALSVSEARLLAVLTLDAIDRPSLTEHVRPIVQGLAEIAISMLVSHGEAGHVLDLVRRYGTAALGTEGFIVTYVRGLLAYQKARDAHAETDGSADDPTADEGVANLYRSAAELLRDAVELAPEDAFTEERIGAGISAGLAFYYADLPAEASRWLESVFRLAEGTDRGEEALWLSILSADRAVSQEKLPEDHLRALAAIYLQRYPSTERAARLLLRQATAGLLSDEEAVRILLSVSGNDELRRTAERHAASILYRLFRNAPPSRRDAAALRFAEVAERALDRELSRAPSGRDEADAERTLTLARRLLDALLATSDPDLRRARDVLDTIDRLAGERGVSLEEIADELAFHRLRIALASSDDADARMALDELHRIGGAYADAGDRLMYRHALEAWNRKPEDTEAARRVVVHGVNVMTQYEAEAESIAQPAVATLYDRVAQAAFVVWRGEDDPQMLDIERRVDAMLIESGNTSESVIRRYAETSELAGDLPGALEMWRTLSAATRAPDPRWYEARYHTLRLLARLDPARARQVYEQHRVLHPELGPDPWGPRIETLAQSLPPPPARAPPEREGDS